MKVFITGGCKTGKSTLALKLSLGMRRAEGPLYYIATMIPADGEDRARIERHRSERAGLGFVTEEAPKDVASLLDRCDKNGFFLFDSVTALLANEMFAGDGSVIPDAYVKVTGEMDRLMSEVSNIAVVSDYIHSDACIYGGATESFRYALALIHRRLARTCDAVVEVCCGNYTVHKGAPDFNGIIHAVY